MKLINQGYMSLPGLHKLPIKRFQFKSDLLFFILFTGIPTSFYAFINQEVFYRPQLYLDINVLFLLVSLIYLIYNIKHLPKLFLIPGGKAFFVLVLYLFFQVFYSYLFMGINLKEILTIFRKNFFWPIATLGFLLYASKFNIYRLKRFFRWLIILTIIQSVIYLIANLFNIDFYGTKSANEYLLNSGTVYMQNLYAVPKYLMILFVFSFVTVLTSFKYNKHWQWLLCLMVVGILVVRSTLIVFTLTAIIILLLIIIRHNTLYLHKKQKILLSGYFKNVVKVVGLILFILIILITIYPDRINFLIAKFLSVTVNVSSNYYSNASFGGTFTFRLLLIGEAFVRTMGNLLFGNGYIRESVPGTYDFVLGGDTAIAPVIFCEGVVGMLLRWLPITIIMMVSLKYIFSKNSKRYYLYYVSIFALIIISIINVIQTDIFVRFDHLFFIFMMMQFIIYHDRKKTTNSVQYG